MFTGGGALQFGGTPEVPGGHRGAGGGGGGRVTAGKYSVDGFVGGGSTFGSSEK